VRKWTKSACVVVALGIGLLLAVVGFTAVTGCGGSAHPAQAKTSIASSSSSSSGKAVSSSRPAVLAGAPGGVLAEEAAPVAAGAPVTWIVRPGETLSGIAAALGLRGGWQALYAASQQAVGADPDVIRPGTVLTVPGTGASLRYAVAPGDTLSGIAAALGLRGGWQALYAANQQVIGPDPGLIRPGTVLAVPGAAAAGKAPSVPGTNPGTRPGGHHAPPPPPTRGVQSPEPPAGSTPGTLRSPAVPGSASPAGLVPVRGSGAGTGAGGVMPRWLKATLLAVGVLTVAAFIAQPAVTVAARRRRRAVRAGAAGRRRDRGHRAAAAAARIVQADHERLIITYSMSDDTVYLLTPPGEDPRAVLRAARLVVPEDTYEDLADHLGVPSGWQRE
jgi:LysM repeat protein